MQVSRVSAIVGAMMPYSDGSSFGSGAFFVISRASLSRAGPCLTGSSRASDVPGRLPRSVLLGVELRRSSSQRERERLRSFQGIAAADELRHRQFFLVGGFDDEPAGHGVMLGP